MSCAVESAFVKKLSTCATEPSACAVFSLAPLGGGSCQARGRHRQDATLHLARTPAGFPAHTPPPRRPCALRGGVVSRAPDWRGWHRVLTRAGRLVESIRERAAGRPGLRGGSRARSGVGRRGGTPPLPGPASARRVDTAVRWACVPPPPAVRTVCVSGRQPLREHNERRRPPPKGRHREAAAAVGRATVHEASREHRWALAAASSLLRSRPSPFPPLGGARAPRQHTRAAQPRPPHQSRWRDFRDGPMAFLARVSRARISGRTLRAATHRRAVETGCPGG